jgi:hypothetical protein
VAARHFLLSNAAELTEHVKTLETSWER